MKTLLSLTLALSSLFIGCAQQLYVLSDEYQEKQLRANAVAVPPISLVILNPDDVNDDLGPGVVDSVYRAYFEPNLQKALRSWARIDTILFLERMPDVTLTKRVLKIDTKQSIAMELPTDGTILPLVPTGADFILFLDQFFISRVEGSSSNPAIGMPGSSGGLRHELQFAIWDNTNGRLVSFGKISEETEIILFSMTKGNWDSVLDKVAYKISRASPFFENRE